MAATNFTPIQLYFSTTASAVPLAANLAQGELAINITDGKLYYEDNGGVVQVIATKGAGTIGGSTTQIQYNNAGALAGNAAMVFNNSTNVTTLTTLNLTNALGAIYGGTAQSTYTQGDILYSSATNTLAKLGIGVVNYILTSTGTVPQWVAPSSITVNTATNLAGGLAGSVPYQSALDTTTFLAIGAANRVMTSTGTAPQWVTSLTGLTGVSSSSITNTSLTSGRVVVSTTAGLQADDADLTFDGTTLSAGGFSTVGLSTLVKTVKIGDSNFNGVAVFAAATPAKLYMGTGTVTDVTSAISATNAIGAIASLGITPIAATNTSVTYTDAATLYIAGAPSAGTNVTLTNPYALYVASGNAYFGGTVTAGTVNLTTLDLTNLEVTNIKAKDGTASITLADTTGIATFSGATVFTAGTALLPAITTTGDTNTGIWFPAADTIAFTEGGVESMRIDSSGNLGLGVTPSAWSSASRPALQLTNGAALFTRTGSTFLSQNFFYNAGDTGSYIANGFATVYVQTSGQHQWYNAPSGTANNTAALTQAMTLDASGRLLVGTTSGSGATMFTVNQPTASTDAKTIVSVTTGTNAAFTAFVNTTVTTVGTENSSGGSLVSGSSAYSTVIANNGAYPISFGTNNTERARIDSSGNVGIGTNNPAEKLSVAGAIRVHTASSAGFTLDAKGGLFDFVPSSNTVRVGYVPGTSGVNTGILTFLVGSGSTAATIDSSGNFIVGTGNENGQFTVRNASANKATAAIIASNTSGPNYAIDAVSHATAANTPSLIRGYSGSASPTQVFNLSGFGNITQFGGQIFFPATQSASTDANCLDDYEEGTWTPVFSAGGITGTSITYSGTYTKIGRVVSVSFRAQSASNNINVSSYVVFSGLPFTVGVKGCGSATTEDIDVFASLGFAEASGTSLGLSKCGNGTTSDLNAMVTFFV
jgi:hypothetical protein